jgi:hypothetical protein
MNTTVVAAMVILAIDLTPFEARSVTQEFLDQDCRKTDIRVIGTEATLGARPAKLIIGYTCNEHAQGVEYEALHFLCPHRGPKSVAAAVYDVQEQTYLSDFEGTGDYRSVVKLAEISTPSCDLPL